MQMLLEQLSERYGIALFSHMGAAELQVIMERALDAQCGLGNGPKILGGGPVLKSPQAASNKCSRAVFCVDFTCIITIVSESGHAARPSMTLAGNGQGLMLVASGPYTP